MEYELVDTGIFDEDRYFDVEVEYAKSQPEDMVCRITVHNRSAHPASLHVLPTLWFRNTWSWSTRGVKPQISQAPGDGSVLRAEHPEIGVHHLYAEPEAQLLFCDNETNSARLWGSPESPPFPKDGIGDHLIHGRPTVNPAGIGTKASAHRLLEIPAGVRPR